MDLYPIRVDVSKLSFPVVVSAVAPLLPGGILLFAFCLDHINWVHWYFTTSPVGYYSNVFCFLVGAYLSGFMLLMLVDFASSLFWIALNLATRSSITKFLGKPWEGSTFRKAATVYLGEAAPSHMEVFNPALENIKDIPINFIADPKEKAKAQLEAQRRRTALSQSDFEWASWYQVFKTYFGFPNQAQVFAGQLCGIVHSVGWAGIIFLASTGHKSVFFYSVFVASILIGLFVGTFWLTCLYGGFGPDTLGPAITAALLREIPLGSEKMPDKQA